MIDKSSYTTFVNPRMAEMLGYTVEEMIGKHMHFFMDARGIELSTSNFKRRLIGIKEQHEFELIHKNGTRIYTIMETAPIKDEHGLYVGALAGVIDITDRKRMEEELKTAKEKAETY